MRRIRSPFAFVLLAVLSGCDPDAKLCHEKMTSAQAIVNGVDGKSLDSVQRSLAAVTEAHAACEKAQLGSEREQLLKAKNELSAQLSLLEARANRKKLQPPSAEELARLVKNGDPSCPKGQAYKPKGSKSEVRCTGPQLCDMNLQSLKQYFSERQYKVTENPNELRAEHGSELFAFAFDEPSGAPRCITAYTPSGTSWQEAVARLTGADPERLKLNAPVKSSRELPLVVDHPTDQPTVRLGNCAQAPKAP
jgi:hypothetical protein